MRLLNYAFPLALFLFISICLPAQRVTTDYILGTPETVMNRYDRSNLDFYHVQMPLGFANDSLSTLDRKWLETGTIYQIDLVFSDYRSSKTFSQEDLNRRRLESLQESFPKIFDNTAIKWVLVRQTAASTRKEARNLFHGFVFHLRTPTYVSKEDGKSYHIDGKAERDLLHSILADTLPPGYTTNLPFPIKPVLDTIVNEEVEIKRTTETTGKWIAARKKRRIKGMKFNRKRIWARTPESITIYDTLYSSDTLFLKDSVLIVCRLGDHIFRMDRLTSFSVYQDSVVKKTFMEHPEWKNILVVEDVTGSMYPYIGQTLAWRRLGQPKRNIQHWAFFNDGDGYPDGPIGRSDGVHYIQSEEQDPVEEKVEHAMSMGYGGAAPENDIEAMGKALNRSRIKPEAIVLVADNNSPVRDLKLFNRLRESRIPVYVIVCGAMWGYINVEYLEIARRTKGKVFTMEGELTGLLEMSEGETLEIGGQKFRVEKGKMILTR